MREREVEQRAEEERNNKIDRKRDNGASLVRTSPRWSKGTPQSWLLLRWECKDAILVEKDSKDETFPSHPSIYRCRLVSVLHPSQYVSYYRLRVYDQETIATARSHEKNSLSPQYTVNPKNLPQTMNAEHVAAQRAYMRYHNMNPIHGVSSKQSRSADPDP